MTASARQQLVQRLDRFQATAARRPPLAVSGTLTRVVGITLEARGCPLSLGDRCRVQDDRGDWVEAETVGFDGDRVYLMAVQDTGRLAPAARVEPRSAGGTVAVGESLLGRVIDSQGRPLDSGPPLLLPETVPLVPPPRNPLDRALIDQPLDVGVRGINAVATLGRGQRVGLFAPSGVGKSTLLGMMTRYTEADVVVVGLVGERGREVSDFVHRVLGPAGLRKAVVVASPADTPPLMRVHGALRATAVAEYFRDRGSKVLLLMDSLTRYAQALREVALAIGEPPATQGYTPSVFARLPQLIERAGTGRDGRGSITAVYTVLTEDEDLGDPITYAARAVLDGHIVLSRAIAEQGRYPAIDIEPSISRLMPDVVNGEHLQLARRFRAVSASYAANRELINMGAYRRGSDPAVDEAMALHPAMERFLGQAVDRPADIASSVAAMRDLFASGAAGAGHGTS